MNKNKYSVIYQCVKIHLQYLRIKRNGYKTVPKSTKKHCGRDPSVYLSEVSTVYMCEIYFFMRILH